MTTSHTIIDYIRTQKKSSSRLLPLDRIGLCLADDNLSGQEDSIQGTGWSLALMAILQPFFVGALGEPKAIIRHTWRR